jgi:hypothetical protein
MKVLFGRGSGEKTLGKIVKINRKNFKVETLEVRGTKKTHRKGGRWNVPPSLCKPAPSAEPSRQSAPSAEPSRQSAPSAEPSRQSAPSAEPSRVKIKTTTSWSNNKEVRNRRAREAAGRSERRLKAACDLSNPPTYIKASRRYLDGTTIRKRGDEYDGQRQKLYDAEKKCTRGTEFKTFRQAERYLDKMLNSAWFNRRFNNPNVTLRPGRGSGSACYSNGSIRLSTKNHMCERILIHELTHALVPKPHAGHGRLFCAIYLDLVRHFMGEDAYDQLVAGYRAKNVKYQPHRSAKR